jgi:drug/metabolite transporter (DMT)-like permease
VHAAALSPAVTLIVLAAAIVHAIWNAIAHGIKDQAVAFGLIGVGTAVAAVPVIALSARPSPASWPYLATSVVIHMLYCLLLMRSYQYGEFGQVYPIARGTSPLVVTVLAAAFAHERPSAAEAGGVLVVSAGLAILAFGGRRIRSGRTAVLAAAGTGLTIAAYTTVDGIGVRAAHSPAGYAGWLMLLQSIGIGVITFLMRRREIVRQPRAILLSGLAAGVLSLLAYGLVLWAQTRGAIAGVAALRETSVIFGAIIGTVFFKEPFGRTRVAAAITVAAGIVLLGMF